MDQTRSTLTPSDDQHDTNARNDFGNIYIGGHNARVLLGNQYSPDVARGQYVPTAATKSSSGQQMRGYVEVVAAVIELVWFSTKILDELVLCDDAPDDQLDAAADSLAHITQQIDHHQSRVMDSLYKKPTQHVIEECRSIATGIYLALEERKLSSQSHFSSPSLYADSHSPRISHDGVEKAQSALAQAGCAAMAQFFALPWKSLSVQTSLILGTINERNEILRVLCQQISLIAQKYDSICQKLQQEMLCISDRASKIELEKSLRTGQESNEPAVIDLDRKMSIIGDEAIELVNVWLSDHLPLIHESVSRVVNAFEIHCEKSVRVAIQRGLGFQGMDSRHDAIHEAHESTLDWLFDSSGALQESGNSFAQWLHGAGESTAGPFWVQGKPGSGKSTLMKRLLHDKRTQELSKAWSGTCKLLIASCFFWAPGTPLQKSLPGLLQSLLYQMLQMDVHFSSDLFPHRWKALEFVRGKTTSLTWTSSELLFAIKAFVSCNTDKVNIFFVVDGLDEFGGTRSQLHEVCELLISLSTSPHVKVCVSSRPWNEFKDAFRDSPTLSMEYVNHCDIYRYVQAKFHANHVYCSWSRAEPRDTSALINEIVRKADGVFLWIYLVVSSLLDGINNGDDMRELSRTLSRIPPDLEDLFDQMLSRIDTHNRESASHIFSFALLGEHFVTVYALSHNDHATIELKPGTNPLKLITDREEIEVRRINARSLGLLDIVESPVKHGGVVLRTRKVRFMHRTARDFFALSIMRDRLAQWRQKTWCAQLELIKAQHRMLRIYTNVAGILPGFLEQVAASSLSIANEYSHMHELADAVNSTKQLLSAALSRPEKLGSGHRLAACGLLEESIPATLHAAISSRNTGVVLYQLQSLSPGTIPRNEFAVCLIDLLNSFESRQAIEMKATTKSPDVFILRHLLRLGLSPHVYNDGDNKLWSVLLRKWSRQILDGGDDFAYLLLKSFLQQGASLQMLIDEGTILQGLAHDRAQELCGLRSKAALEEQLGHLILRQKDVVRVSSSPKVVDIDDHHVAKQNSDISADGTWPAQDLRSRAHT